MPAPVSCPYCNAGIALAVVPPSRRVVCPRCGEAFPVKPADADHLPTASANGSPAPVVAEPAEGHPTGWSLGTLTAIGLLLGLLVVGGGLVAILRTPGPTPEPPPDPSKPAATAPPAAVPGLGYLPADANVVLAVQGGPLRAHADRTNADPKRLLAAVGIPGRVPAALEQAGLKLEQIDHLCAGLSVGRDDLLPRAVVVLALRSPPADRGTFLRQWKATPFTAASGASRYKADLGGLSVELAVPDPTTFLFATEGNDLEKPARRTPPAAHLPAGLRESLDKLSPASFAWAATDADRWADKPAVKLLAGTQPGLAARLAPIRAAAVGLSTEPAARLTTALRATDPDAAKALRDRAAIALAGNPVTIGGSGPWVTVEGPPDRDVWSGLRDLLPAEQK